MSNEKPIINVGDMTGISEPACKLIDKVSDAIGGALKPWQTRRMADAEADAKLKRGMAQIQLEGMQRRAMSRWIEEETRKQANIESITEKAISLLKDDADPLKMDDDWVTNFFEEGKNISNKQMQDLWSKILAREANEQRSFSKRTVKIVGDLEPSHICSFEALCQFCVRIHRKESLESLSSGINPQKIWDSSESVDDLNRCNFSWNCVKVVFGGLPHKTWLNPGRNRSRFRIQEQYIPTAFT